MKPSTLSIAISFVLSVAGGFLIGGATGTGVVLLVWGAVYFVGGSLLSAEGR